VKRRTTQVGIDEQYAVVLVAGQAYSQICCDEALAFRGHTAADKDSLQRTLISKLINLRSKAAKLFNTFAALSERRKGGHRRIPRMQGDILEDNVGLHRRLFLGAGCNEWRSNLWNFLFLCSSPLKVCPL
jgi:hypothetical protein